MHEIKIFNTLGRTKQPFKPIVPGKVSFYHCGPTVYWTQQIGNMFAMSQADFIRRSFEYVGYEVVFVRNYTDVGHLTGDNEGDADAGEDRMEQAARRENKSPEEIAQYYIDEFNADLELLNIKKPTYSPRATEHIQGMIDLTRDLLGKGFAYQTELAIYFDTNSKEDYFKLSGQKREKLLSGSGHGDVSDANKKNITDFALWFFKVGVHANALQTWPNPFSDVSGFPGWHIECSAMIRELLGDTIDIHMGGIEHIPIHHTNEIAQSECANNAPLAHYWIHNEHLLLNKNKMSKSAGTTFTIGDVIEKGYDPLDVRYFFLQAHYRSGQNFTWDAIAASQTARKRLQQKISDMQDGGSVSPAYREKFISFLADDFNIPAALAVVYEVLKSNLQDADKKATILNFDHVLGLALGQESESTEDTISHEVQLLLEERKKARHNKDWALSDELRDKIIDAGFELKDANTGQHIRKIL